MKPQALQDAIKLKAQKRAESWKEPEVKRHVMTKEEYEALQKEKSMSPMKIALDNSTNASPVSTINKEMIQGMLDKNKFEMKQEMNKILEAMKSLSTKSPADEKEIVTPTTNENNHEVISLIIKVKDELTELRQTVKELRDDNAILTDIKEEIVSLRREIRELKTSSLAFKPSSSVNGQDPVTPVNNAKGRVSLPTPTTSSTNEVDPVTPVSMLKEKVPTSPTSTTPNIISMDREERKKKQLEPHGAERLYEAQRRDDLIKTFVKDRTGPYTVEESKIKTIEGRNLLYFRKKIYIPQQLRKDTVHHYCSEYSTQEEALKMLQELCIWPDLEADFKRFKLGG